MAEMIALALALHFEGGDVADEAARLLLAELDAANVLRLTLHVGEVDVDAEELRVRERGATVLSGPNVNSTPFAMTSPYPACAAACRFGVRSAAVAVG